MLLFATTGKQMNATTQPTDQLFELCIRFCRTKINTYWIGFNVLVQHVCIFPDLFRRIYSLMGNILSIILDTLVKSKGKLFLKTKQLACLK